MLKSSKADSGTLSSGYLLAQLSKVEMLDVNKIGGLFGDWIERSIRFLTPAMCGSKDSRFRLKSTCHWSSVVSSQ